MNGTDFAAKRKAAGLKQEDIETITGIAQATISRFELGVVCLGQDELARLENALDYRRTLSVSRRVRPAAGQSSGEESIPQA